MAAGLNDPQGWRKLTRAQQVVCEGKEFDRVMVEVVVVVVQAFDKGVELRRPAS
jgi:hypothetical protein